MRRTNAVLRGGPGDGQTVYALRLEDGVPVVPFEYVAVERHAHPHSNGVAD